MLQCGCAEGQQTNQKIGSQEDLEDTGDPPAPCAWQDIRMHLVKKNKSSLGVAVDVLHPHPPTRSPGEPASSEEPPAVPPGATRWRQAERRGRAARKGEAGLPEKRGTPESAALGRIGFRRGRVQGRGSTPSGRPAAVIMGDVSRPSERCRFPGCGRTAVQAQVTDRETEGRGAAGPGSRLRSAEPRSPEVSARRPRWGRSPGAFRPGLLRCGATRARFLRPADLPGHS
ncbi:hypothetical protein H8959_004955 [Pygathrix nigripes]